MMSNAMAAWKARSFLSIYDILIMLETNGSWFSKVVRALDETLSTCRHFLDKESALGVEQSRELCHQISIQYGELLTRVGQTVEHFQLEQTHILVDRFEKWFGYNQRRLLAHDIQATHDAVRELRDRFIDELKTRVVFVMPSGKTKYYRSGDFDPLFGSVVAEKFPSTIFEIREAGNCFAMSRYTACVFHLMRCLEIGLRTMSHHFGLELTNDNWQTILDAIKKKVEAIKDGPVKDRAETWKTDYEYYSQLVVNFSVFRDAWRNCTAHARGKFTEEEAESIWYSVRAFTVKLSEKFSE